MIEMTTTNPPPASRLETVKKLEAIFDDMNRSTISKAAIFYDRAVLELVAHDAEVERRVVLKELHEIYNLDLSGQAEHDKILKRIRQLEAEGKRD
jgi:hypothetical protein